MEISFRKIKEEDLDLIKNWRNQDRIRKNSRDHRLLTMEDQLKWFQKISTSESDDMFLVLDSGAPVGVCGLTWINKEHRSAEIAYYLGRQKNPAVDVAVGLEVYVFIKKKGFEEYKLNRIHGEVITYNGGGIKLADYCGFKKEGIKRQSIFCDGKYWDSIVVSMLAEEYYTQ